MALQNLHSFFHGSFIQGNRIFSFCSSSDEQELIFIGDSLIANWDVERFFPSFATKNYGLSGSCIDHIENYAHCFEGKDVVVRRATLEFLRLPITKIKIKCLFEMKKGMLSFISRYHLPSNSPLPIRRRPS